MRSSSPATERVPPPGTVADLLLARSRDRGEHPALTASGVTCTYSELARRASAMGGALRDRGIRAGDTVTVMAKNRIDVVDVLLGCCWIGAVAAPIDPELRGDGLREVLTRSGSGHVFTERAHTGRIADAGFSGRVWAFGDTDTPEPHSAACIAPAVTSPLDTAMVLFTSGTTGSPKGVLCPHGQFVRWGIDVGNALAVTRDDVLFTSLPLFHTNAINALFQAFTAGATIVVTQRFSVSTFWAQARDSGATVTYLLGAMVALLANAPAAASDRAHTVGRALAPATPAHLHQPFLHRFGVALVDGFGSTETNYVIGNTVSTLRPGYLGTVRPGYEAAVRDPDDQRDLPDGTAGELVVRTTNAGAFATGYLGGPAFEPLSWRRTGDRVVRDADGWFRFVDRIKDVIRRRGENVSSVEVEAVLGRDPSIAQVAVFAVPSPLAEDDVMAAVVPRAGRTADPLDIVRRAEAHLPYFALPRYVDVVGALPLTETGKVRKAELTARGVGTDTWDAEAVGYRPTRVTEAAEVRPTHVTEETIYRSR